MRGTGNGWILRRKKVYKSHNHHAVVCDTCPCCPECYRHRHAENYTRGYQFSVSGIPCDQDCETGETRTWEVDYTEYHRKNPSWWTCLWSVPDWSAMCRTWYTVDEKCKVKELARTKICDESPPSPSPSPSPSHSGSSSSLSSSSRSTPWIDIGYYRVFSCGTQYTPYFGALTPEDCGMQVEPLPEFEAFQQYCVTKADLDSLLTSPYALHECTGETIEAGWDYTENLCKLKINGKWRGDYYSCYRPVKVCYSSTGYLPWYCMTIDTCTPPWNNGETSTAEDDIQ